MTLDELLPVTFGSIENGGDRGAVIDRITELKLDALQRSAKPGVSSDSLSVDTPVPFCIHKLWFDLHCEMRATHHQMRRQAVSSSNVSEVGYDEGSRTLEVLFTNGSIYQYFDVPPQIYAELIQTGSIGQYLNANIKGNFRYARV
jgi:hypothetical protein